MSLHPSQPQEVSETVWSPSRLFVAILAGRIDEVREQIRAGGEKGINEERNMFGRPAIVEAGRVGCVDSIALLVAGNARIDLPDTKGRTALMHAGFFGHGPAVRLLLEKGASTNIFDKNGDTVLISAIVTRREEVVRDLLFSGHADPELVTKRGDTPLVMAALSGCTGIVVALAHARADLNRTGADDLTALMSASVKGGRDAVRALLLEGADPHVVNRYGYTALTYASLWGWEEIVRDLLMYAPSPDEVHRAHLKARDHPKIRQLLWQYVGRDHTSPGPGDSIDPGSASSGECSEGEMETG
ncbi:MAG: ankyrin repeat domain-containing protein [Simkaniaceae bacterium]|nr:ankyrin repeat domain-containing protein [Simkaniaceae bacterium]